MRHPRIFQTIDTHRSAAGIPRRANSASLILISLVFAVAAAAVPAAKTAGAAQPHKRSQPSKPRGRNTHTPRRGTFMTTDSKRSGKSWASDDEDSVPSKAAETPTQPQIYRCKRWASSKHFAYSDSRRRNVKFGKHAHAGGSCAKQESAPGPSQRVVGSGKAFQERLRVQSISARRSWRHWRRRRCGLSPVYDMLPFALCRSSQVLHAATSGAFALPPSSWLLRCTYTHAQACTSHGRCPLLSVKRSLATANYVLLSRHMLLHTCFTLFCCFFVF